MALQLINGQYVNVPDAQVAPQGGYSTQNLNASQQPITAGNNNGGFQFTPLTANNQVSANNLNLSTIPDVNTVAANASNSVYNPNQFLASDNVSANNMNLSTIPGVDANYAANQLSNTAVSGAGDDPLNTSGAIDLGWNTQTVGIGLGALQTFLGYQYGQDQLALQEGQLALGQESLAFKKEQYQNRLDASAASVAESEATRTDSGV